MRVRPLNFSYCSLPFIISTYAAAGYNFLPQIAEDARGASTSEYASPPSLDVAYNALSDEGASAASAPKDDASSLYMVPVVVKDNTTYMQRPRTPSVSANK